MSNLEIYKQWTTIQDIGNRPFRPQDNCGDVSASPYVRFGPNSYIPVNYITDLSIIILFRCAYFIFVIWYN